MQARGGCRRGSLRLDGKHHPGAGSKWAIGTEINLVTRLARQNPDKEIHSLSPFQCLCSTMYRIKPKYLLWVLDNLVEGEVKNQVTVDPETAKLARIALDRMLAI